jgi:hypothetical protein
VGEVWDSNILLKKEHFENLGLADPAQFKAFVFGNSLFSLLYRLGEKFGNF